MYTQAYWGALFDQRRKIMTTHLLSATISWELNKYHDIEVAYYRAKAAVSTMKKKLEEVQ